MYDRIIAIVSLGLFAGFLAILGYWVESTSLGFVIAVGVLLAAYDFWRSQPRSNGDKRR